MSDEGARDKTAEPVRGSRGPVVLALSILFGSVAILAYSPWGDVAWGGIAALVGIPFSIGMLIGTRVKRDNMVGCFVWPTLVISGLLFAAYLVFGEGVICIAMILPIWIVAAIGGCIACTWRSGRTDADRSSNGADTFRLAAWSILPAFLIVVESYVPPAWSDYSVSSDMIVDAAPERVWPHLAEIRNVGPKEGVWTFTHDILRVPRPLDARLERTAAGQVRLAKWGEGIAFEERIVAKAPGRSVQWQFAFPDRSLQDHTDRHISPDGETLHIQSGGYVLEPLADGRTRIRLTTSYAVRSRIPSYLALWADRMIGDVQQNVLEIVANRAEAGR